MKYLCLIYDAAPTGPEPEPGTPEFDAFMEPWVKVNEAFVAAGVMAGGEALLPPETATSVRVREGQTETMDGPFAETKERLGGYYMLDCADLDEAIRYAAMIPTAKHGTIEVRQVMDLSEFE
jgi:hypothetical protein